MMPRVRSELRSWQAWVALAGLAGLVVFQGWMYNYRIPLSMGPRVILEPWLLEHGFRIYEDIADLHTPLVPLALSALLPLVPNALRLARLVMVGLLSLTTLLTFAVSLRGSGWLGGLGAAAFFVAWSPSYVFGKLWYESFLAPIYLLWLVLYDPGAERRSVKSLVGVGLLGGIAVLVKQHSVVVLGALVLWGSFASWRAHHSLRRPVREMALILLAAVLPVGIFLVYQDLRAGTLAGLYYWIITYPLTGVYAALAAKPLTMAQFQALAPSFVFVPAAVCCLVHARQRGDKVWLHLGGVLVLLLASGITAYPEFYPWHLQGTLPVLAALSALTLSYVFHSQPAARFFTVSLTGALAVFWLITQGSIYQQAYVARYRQIAEYSNLGPLADEIRQRIGPSDCVYLFPNDEATSNLYYLLKCLPPRYWVLQYAWNMIEPIKSRALLALEKDPPEWVVFFPGDQKAGQRTAPEVWDYISRHYREETRLPQGQVLLRRLGP